MAVTRRWIRWGAGGSLLLALAAAGAAGALRLHRAGADAGRPLPALADVPAFSLIDQEGRALSRDGLRGRVWIADFIFTRCAGQCPMMSRQMALLAQELPGAQFVSFSVDPAYDQPEVLAAYARLQHAERANWRFATGGDPEAVRRLCQEGFKLSAAEGGAPAEPIIHSRRFVLVDRQGRIRGYYDAGEADELAALRRDARRLLREPP